MSFSTETKQQWYTRPCADNYHPNMTQNNPKNLPHCGLLRRLAAIIYDSLLLLAILFGASAIHLMIIGTENADSTPDLLRTLFIFLVSFAFFAWFWTHGGQTLGMRAWRIRLQNRGGGTITLWQAMLRFLVAIVSWLPFGAGYIWSLFDKEGLTWHDRYSMSELVVIPKGQAKQ